MRFSGILFAWLLAVAVGVADDKADLAAARGFKEAYVLLTGADEARDRGEQDVAIAFYSQAGKRYAKLATGYPDWTPEVVKFRITYCSNQLEALRAMAGEGAAMTMVPSELTLPDDTVAPPVEAPMPTNIVGVKRQATALLQAGKADEAQALLAEGIRLDPDNVSVRLLLGVAHCQAGRFEGAVFLLEQVVKEVPLNGPAHVVLGTAYFGQGDLPEARAELELSLRLKEDMPEAHYNLAKVLLQADPVETNKAAWHYRRALALGGGADARLDFLRELPPEVMESEDE